MVQINKSVRCTNCNKELNLTLTTEIGMNDLTLNGKCNYCGNSLQVNFSVVGSEGSATVSANQNDLPSVSIDENLLEPELPSEAIKDLMD